MRCRAERSVANSFFFQGRSLISVGTCKVQNFYKNLISNSWVRVDFRDRFYIQVLTMNRAEILKMKTFKDKHGNLFSSFLLYVPLTTSNEK